jgi:membrane protease YdiL (CAAX protease family)
VDALTISPFVLLLIAVLGLWVHRAVWVVALIAAVALGIYTGALGDLAGAWIAICALLAWGYAQARARATTHAGRVLQLVAGVAFFGYTLVMALPLLPGFHRVELVPAQVLSEGAVPYALAVGFPKVVAGILILGLINPVLVSPFGLARVAMNALPVFLVTTALVIVCALALGYTRFGAHWHELFIPWAVVNLFSTCLGEEAFFRGFVQRELGTAGPNRALWGGLALVVGAVLFGLVHYPGGVSYVIAGVIAGLGYGLAFLRTQRIEAAMLVHFGVNAVHFLLFVYPRPA